VGWFVWVLAGFVAACGIEATQMLFLSGRQPSAVDVVANTLGALVGAVLAVLLLRSGNRPQRQAQEPAQDVRPQ
jgi:VanZ family protein